MLISLMYVAVIRSLWDARTKIASKLESTIMRSVLEALRGPSVVSRLHSCSFNGTEYVCERYTHVAFIIAKRSNIIYIT